MNTNDKDNKWLDVIKQNIETLRFGEVQIIVHDSKIVQVERTEKIRLDNQPANGKKLNKTSHC